MNLLLDAVAVEHYAHGVDVGRCDERKENDGFELMFSHDEYSLVGVVDSGVTAHGFEHYFLGDVVA